MGKRGGARVIYFFHDRQAPIYLLAVFAKSARADLTPGDRALLARLAATLKQRIRAKRHAQEK
jgi:hypothetical protein